MIPPKTFEIAPARARLIYGFCLCLSLGIALLKSGIFAAYVADSHVMFGNDSMMRLVSVRNWLAGQAWFDMTEYRLMPPEGVVMHWSRYIDAPLGGLIAVLSQFMSQAQAEFWAITIWPNLLSVVLIVIVGAGTHRLFGLIAACFAMLMTAVWPVTHQNYFMAGNIDHHNVQIVLIVALTLMVLDPKAPLVAGLWAGVLAALALAIGLETLLYILVLGVVLFLRANLRLHVAADSLLAGFSIMLFAGAVLFWFGQTDPARWTVPVCDQLGLPVIALTAIAAAACLLPMLLFKERVLWRLVTGVGAVALGCLLAWPLLGPCLAGPYGSLPPEVQDIIRNNIIEARPGPAFALRTPIAYVEAVLPVVGGLVIASLIAWRLPKAGPTDRRYRDTLCILLILSCVGLIASFSQFRLILMSAPAAPVLVGAVMAVLVGRYLATRTAGDAILMFVAVILLVTPMLLLTPLERLIYAQDHTSNSSIERTANTDNSAIRRAGFQDATCRDTALMAKLNTLPPTVIFTSLNLGPPIIASTHHSTLSGPYHRSPAAFANGFIPLRMDEVEFRAHLAGTNATHLMLCRGSVYGETGLATALASGEASADWLIPISIDAGDILVFEIAPEN